MSSAKPLKENNLFSSFTSKKETPNKLLLPKMCDRAMNTEAQLSFFSQHRNTGMLENQQFREAKASLPVLVENYSNCIPEVDLALEKEKKNKKKKDEDEMKNVVLHCEWNLCVVSMWKMEKFLLHVAEHVASANGPPTHDGYVCQWRDCDFASHSKDEYDRHVYFHAFHSKLKGIGATMEEKYNLKCKMDSQSRNLIPEIAEPFECMWDGCGFTFVSAQDYYWHVHGHVVSVQKEDNFFHCSWEGCTYKVNKQKLSYHTRSHTQEKVTGCPNCGSIFASESKFVDHCHRHMIVEDREAFECSHCKGKFASERLLKEHVRRHVNQVKCPHCEMTCTTKTTMETHIKYRHTNNKPLKCPQCPKRFKLQQDIEKHLPRHSEQPSFVCYHPSCSFSSRSYTAYIAHTKVVHEGAKKCPYVCHMCDKKFARGVNLTVHLKNVHDYHWPPGHTRFRYSRDEEGYYKLQTTRFEIIDLAQEILDDDENLDDPEPLPLEGTEERDSVHQELDEEDSNEADNPAAQKAKTKRKRAR